MQETANKIGNTPKNHDGSGLSTNYKSKKSYKGAHYGSSSQASTNVESKSTATMNPHKDLYPGHEDFILVKAPKVKDISGAKTTSPPLAPTNFFV